MKPTQALFDQLPPQHSMAEFLRILEADFVANHQGREYDLDYINSVMRLWRDSGAMIFCAPNVMFVVEERTDGMAEFHSVNGGSAKDLSFGVNTLLKALAAFYEEAVTYYDNPRVNDLLKHSDYPASFTRIDDGLDKTFEAIFKLKG